MSDNELDETILPFTSFRQKSKDLLDQIEIMTSPSEESRQAIANRNTNITKAKHEINSPTSKEKNMKVEEAIKRKDKIDYQNVIDEA